MNRILKNDIKVPHKIPFLTVHDKSGKYLRVCDSFLLVTGFSKKEVIGKSAYEFFYPESIKDILESHLTQSVSSVIYRYVRKDGKPIYLKTVSFKSVSDKMGESSEIYCYSKQMSKFEIFMYKIHRGFIKIFPNI